MGTIILFVCCSILLAFLLGVMFDARFDSYDDSNALWFIITMFFLGTCIGLSIFATQEYYEKKEYSSVKYDLKKKVITIEEDNTIKLDTLYKFMRK